MTDLRQDLKHGPGDAAADLHQGTPADLRESMTADLRETTTADLRENATHDPRESTTHDMRQLTALGRSIEDESFAVIDREAGAHAFSVDEWSVVRRIIHATADFELQQLVRFHPGAIRAGIDALRGGCPVLVDVKMIAAGLNEARLAAYGCAVTSFISDDDVIAAARANNSTRAIEAMRKAHRLGVLDGAIVAIGNAPTALIEVARLVREDGAAPALVIGVPVGFVSAAESKEIALALPTPFIVVRGRKGGSPIAVAIIHALLMLSAEVAR
jgi:precorrin-8X/cobalt-precorrin-8 methylmutase